LLRAELESRVGLAPRLGSTPGADFKKGSVVALVGPRGSGKTTSLAKLAVSGARFANVGQARMLSLDVARATAHMQLQSVASTYQMAFQQVPADYLLPQLIADIGGDETIFIDTPGYTCADANALGAAAAALEQCPGLDVHLVVPGYMKARDLRQCIERYSAFRPNKLLVTKLDETQALGSIFSEAARAGMKLSFLSYGPGIPHDIRAATSEDLLGLAVDRLSTDRLNVERVNLDRPKVRAQHVA
jgi:flagellar biosynthesis protein FlhF